MVYHWPALLLGLIVGAYWARVVKMVLKQRRTTGRSANFFPRETLGQILRIIWYPAVLVWVLAPLVIALLPRNTILLRVFALHPALSWIGVAVAFICLGLTWICWKKMGKSWRMGIDPAEKTQLVITGPYAYVRHPIYALQILLAAASMLAVPATILFIACGIVIVFLYWEARREEQYLVGVHGETYARFLRNVGGFIPRSLKPYRPTDR